MNYGCDMAKTPAGATLGRKIIINGDPGLHYKAGKKEDDLTMEQLVECASGRKVRSIIYEPQTVRLLR